MTVAQILQSLEEQLVDPVLRRDPEIFESLFADEFREFGSSGRTFDKRQILAAIRCDRYTPPQLSEFATTLLAPNLALVTYRAERPGNLASLRSSLWIFREQRWQILFHQGTIIPVIVRDRRGAAAGRDSTSSEQICLGEIDDLVSAAAHHSPDHV